MPGLKRTCTSYGKKRLRRTPYRYVAVREADFYNFHRVADKFRMSLADTFALIVAERLKAFNVDPVTPDDLKRMENGEFRG